MEISLQDMSCKIGTRKFNTLSLKKKLNSKGQVKEKKGGKHPRFSFGFVLAPWTPFKLLLAPRKALQEQEKRSSFNLVMISTPSFNLVLILEAS